MAKIGMMFAGQAVILLLLGGCEKTAGGQVVAVVNGEEITQQDLNGELQGATIPAGVDKSQALGQVLQQIVDRKLLVQEAKAQGLDKSPEYLAQVRRSQDGLMINLLASKATKGISLPDGAAVDRYIATNPTMFSARRRYSLDQITFPQPANPKILKDLGPAHSLDSIAAILSANGVQFSRGKGQLDTATLPPAVANRLAALPSGEPFLVPDKGRMVASVITATQAFPTPEQEAKPAAVNLMRQQSLSEAMLRQLEKARASAKIDYKPGFAPAKRPAGGTTIPSATKSAGSA
jgi:EpsD family peptidyl-prolyl cis-trans isomerase